MGDDRTAEHPVLVQSTWKRDGTEVRSLRVFCDRERRSVDVESCVACEACLRVERRGRTRFIRCAPGVPPNAPLAGAHVEPESRWIDVGFADDLTAVLAIADGDRPVYVKDGNALVGVIRLAPFAKATRVDVAMASALSVLESAGVREAVLRMARAHLREIPVVTTEGEPVGILRDVDALLALARTPRR